MPVTYWDLYPAIKQEPELTAMQKHKLYQNQVHQEKMRYFLKHSARLRTQIRL